MQVHAAADGGLARSGCPAAAHRASGLACCAPPRADLGDPALELTSRGNVQVRALRRGRGGGAGAPGCAAAGLLPSDTHERVRNIIASPLSGRTARHLDVRPVVAAFDAGLCADPAPGRAARRFLVTLDDGRGDVAALGGDVGLHGDRLLLRRRPTVHRGRGDPARRCCSRPPPGRSWPSGPRRAATAWRLAELTDGPARVAAPAWSRPWPSAGEHAGRGGRPVGRTRSSTARAALIVVVPLGRLTAEQSAALVDGRAGRDHRHAVAHRRRAGRTREEAGHVERR